MQIPDQPHNQNCFECERKNKKYIFEHILTFQDQGKIGGEEVWLQVRRKNIVQGTILASAERKGNGNGNVITVGWAIQL